MTGGPDPGVFQRAMDGAASAWRGRMAGPPPKEAPPMADKFTFDPGSDPADRRQLAEFLTEAAARTGNPDHITVSFLRALAARIDGTTGPVTMKLTRLDATERNAVRRILFTCDERARGRAEVPRTVAGALTRLLGEWERVIGYDPQPKYHGTRNAWAEPTGASGRTSADLWR